jgi:hypothetical protein
LYCHKLFELLHWLGISQQTIAQRLGVSEPTVSLWATGTRPVAQRHQEAFFTFTWNCIAEVYTRLRPVLSGGIASGQIPPMALPDHILDWNEAEFQYMRLLTVIRPEDGAPADAELRTAIHQLVYLRQLLNEWRSEVVAGDGTVAHEIATALQMLRPLVFLNEEELLQTLTPEVRSAVDTASRTLMRGMRTLAEAALPLKAERLPERTTPVQRRHTASVEERFEAFLRQSGAQYEETEPK